MKRGFLRRNGAVIAMVAVLAGLYCLGLQDVEEPVKTAAASPTTEPIRASHSVPKTVEIIEEPVPLAAEPGFKAWPIPEDFVRTGGCFPDELQEYAWGLCEERNVPYALVYAMIEIESGYKAGAVSGGGAVGYMQVVPCYHRDRMTRLGFDNVLDPMANLAVGIDLMGDLLGKYGDIEQALVVYNTGNAAASSNGYSRAVVARMMQIKEIYENKEAK